MAANSSYELELHEMRDPDLPVIFHQDSLEKGVSILAHWHGNIEILRFVSGHGLVFIEGTAVEAGPGDLVVVDSNRLHRIAGVEAVRYDCLIIDRGFCERFGLPVGRVRLQSKVDSPWLSESYDSLVREITEQPAHYKIAVQAHALNLLSRLYRTFSEEEEPVELPQDAGGQQSHLDMVRDAISYLNRSFARPLTIDEICQEIGFSKYYFCRVFHMVTGRTVVDYLNHLRCEKAQYLLSSGQCNVRESAERCGFRSDSYFSKIYRRQIGELPSDTMQRRTQDTDKRDGSGTSS